MNVVIMRGIAGAGKNWWVEQNLPVGATEICSADEFQLDAAGKYAYREERKAEAHRLCLEKFMNLVRPYAPPRFPPIQCVAICNTNLMAWEIAPYYRIAEVYGHKLEIVRVECSPIVAARRNTHNVPIERVFAMYQTLLTERLPSFWRERIVVAEECFPIT